MALRVWPGGRRAAVIMAAAVFVLAGCGADPAPQARPPSPFAACPATAADPAASANALPAVTLPCFTGDTPVALNRLGRPAIINLWASWCTSCRHELPALQAFADEAADQLLVLGVVTGDSWRAAAETAPDFRVRYANVYDPDRSLQRALGHNHLPVTLFVAADGSVLATDVSGKLTLQMLRSLAAEHLGYVP